ncbi:ATP-binding protein [Brevundimonas naejangsanensis]|uniref:sensor histidine kinase n=1 Tax=unclassified Brevundimonas TaxID=2622653 RepID=UPI0028B04156|nr:ATP-binding protein [Brevundimonas naejangsanensis]
MSFTFEARTLLELGKELISSDEVALYELIKNAVDAGSPKVEILVDVCLTHSDFVEALTRIEDGKTTSEVRDYLQSALIDVQRDRAVQFMTRISTGDDRGQFIGALMAAYNELNTIEIRDTGSGMTLLGLTDVFLRIGTRSRRTENIAGAKNLGDKGIGRLSAMRLGDRLQVKTSTAGETHWNLLDIDWTLFSHDTRKTVDEISVEPVIGEEKFTAADQGTSVVISSLVGDWDVIRFTDLLQGRIARMVDPFQPGLGNKLLIARHNGVRISVPSVPAQLLQSAHAYCQVELKFDGDEPVLTGFVDYRYRHRRIELDERGAGVYSVAQSTVKRRAKRGHAAFKLVPVRPSALQALGGFKADIYWFNRRVVDAVEGLTSNMRETRQEVSNWSGGPMLYRYGFRILPYGDPSDDWLALDENAFGASGFKLNRQQVMGRVLLETPHTALSEQTNREGLMQSEAADALRKILTWVVHTEMRGLINEADEIELIERRESEQDTKLANSARKRVDEALARLRAEVGEGAEPLMDDVDKAVSRLTAQSSSLVDRIEKVIAEADSEREKFVYLAGIGLMTEFIFHELDRAVSHTMDLLAGGSLRQSTIDSLREQLKTLQKRIAAFDELTGEKRQSKSTFDLGDLADEVLSNHAREFDRHGIRLVFNRPDTPLVIKAVRGMLIQILENLIVNSAYWLKQQERFQPGFDPKITVTLDAAVRSLTVEDNGPGVAEDRKERIFQPFITSKPTGQGRGLGLYIARELAEYHGWKLYMDSDVGRVRKDRLNMFVLDMG